MPAAFLLNRKLDGADDSSLADALSGCNYAMVSPCYQLYLMERDFDPSQGVRADSSVGIIVADVQASAATDFRLFPQRVERTHAVLTVVDEARLPPLENLTNVVAIPWGDAKRRVLESLLECATLQWRVGSRTRKNTQA